MNRIKLLALDLDGTTLTSESELTSETKKALEYAAECGIEVVIASGRAVYSLPEEIFSVKGLRYAITSNGGVVTRLSDNARIYEKPIPCDAVTRLIGILKDYPECPVETFVNGIPYSDKRYLEHPEEYGASENAAKYLQNTRIAVDIIRDFTLQHASYADSIDIVCPDKSQNAAIRAMIAENISDVAITSSNDTLIELTHAQTNKGVAVRFICDYLHISADNVAACGNADNDAEMISFAGVGAAVSNASAACIAVSDRIIDTNDNGGVAKFVYEIVGEQK